MKGALAALVVTAAVPVAALIPAGAPAETGAGMPDFSAVESKAAARRLVAEGRLVEIHFVPTELGGPDRPANRGYITPEAAESRALLIGTLTRFVGEGLVDQMEVLPDYKGKSVVPTRSGIRGIASGTRGCGRTVSRARILASAISVA